MALITIRSLNFTYPSAARRALDGVSLSVEKGAFTVICGPSGGGKTTLLRLCRPAIAPSGERSGEILLDGQPLSALDSRAETVRIGFVGQSPEEQLVTDKVWHELAFGLESLGLDTPTIRRRVAEMSSFFGMEEWFHRPVASLSGGQKQLLCLASVMAMQPQVLLLDEPTAQLDPIAASEFLSTLGRINRDLGTTVVLTEHRLEEAFALATDVAVLDGGRLLCRGTPAEVGLRLRDTGIFPAMPAATRIWAAAQGEPPCPVTVRDGRAWLADFAAQHTLRAIPPEQPRVFSETSVCVREAYYRYEKDAPDVLRGVSLTVGRGEFFAILGGNGVGKTTLLRLLTGALKPQRGEIETTGRVALLPQDPRTLFAKKTVREDLLADSPEIASAVALCRLTELLDRHPYDLSGGESQRAALAKVLLPQPDILLLDEPTKGVDAAFRQTFGEILRSLCDRGVTVVLVSHDVEFCARYADRCALLFDGAIAAEGTPRAFFCGNGFYTTAANRMARELLPYAVTAEDVIFACGGEIPAHALPPARELPPVSVPQKARLPWWRVAIAAVSGCAALAMLVLFLTSSSLNELVTADGLTALSWSQLWRYGVFFAALVVLFAAVGRPASRVVRPVRTAVPRRTVAAAVMVVLLIPLTVWLGESVLGGRKYYFVSLLLLLEILLPFFLVFEGRRPKARELTLIAVLCALGVAGRAVFFMLPQFKPVMAITILAGVAFGGETGFLVGAVTMLTSNLMFSQGPWTPWQMVAMGLAGFLAGLIFRRGASRLTLSVFGALAAIFVYGLIMNTASAVIWAHTLEPGILLTYFVTGLPVDCVHAAATWLFLWLLTEPMLEKLERVKRKYGLIGNENGA